jgi:signal peptidase I
MTTTTPSGTVRLRRVKQEFLSFRGFQIYADQLPLGTLRNNKVAEYPLPAGEHTIQIKVDSYKSREQTIQLEPGQVLQLRCGQNVWEVLTLGALFSNSYLLIENDDPSSPSQISKYWEELLAGNLILFIPLTYPILGLYFWFLMPAIIRPFTVMMMGIELTLIAVWLIYCCQLWEFRSVGNNGMAPTLQKGDRMAVRKSKATPQRGDILLFKARIAGRSGVAVSRVVGMPGEEVSLAQGTLLINGTPHTARNLPATYGISMPPTRVPTNTYFVLADNPSASNSDSRNLGPIHANLIQGHVKAIAWPLSRQQPLE